jgi:hypothetical protein
MDNDNIEAMPILELIKKILAMNDESSDKILTALQNLSDNVDNITKIYVQSSAPVNANEGDLWAW